MTSDTSPAGEVFGLLQAISMVLTEDLTEFAEREGMTPARVHLLWALAEGGAMPSHRLAKRLDVTPRTVTGLVDRLADTGHVTRSAHPDDRRSTLVTLIKKGDAFAAKLQAMQDEPLRDDLAHLFDRMRQLVAESPHRT